MTSRKFFWSFVAAELAVLSIVVAVLVAAASVVTAAVAGGALALLGAAMAWIVRITDAVYRGMPTATDLAFARGERDALAIALEEVTTAAGLEPGTRPHVVAERVRAMRDVVSV